MQGKRFNTFMTVANSGLPTLKAPARVGFNRRQSGAHELPVRRKGCLYLVLIRILGLPESEMFQRGSIRATNFQYHARFHD